jgi:hypothetical protein
MFENHTFLRVCNLGVCHSQLDHGEIAAVVLMSPPFGQPCSRNLAPPFPTGAPTNKQPPQVVTYLCIAQMFFRRTPSPRKKERSEPGQRSGSSGHLQTPLLMRFANAVALLLHYLV